MSKLFQHQKRASVVRKIERLYLKKVMPRLEFLEDTRATIERVLSVELTRAELGVLERFARKATHDAMKENKNYSTARMQHRSSSAFK